MKKKSKQRKDWRPNRTTRAARKRASKALGLMRKKGKRRISLSQAAKQAATTPRTVLRYAQGRLIKRSSGQYAAKATGQMVRALRFLTPEGLIVVQVRSARTASLIARYSSAVDHFLKTGETDRLQRFRGKSIRVGKKTFAFVTDPKTLKRLAAVGEVSFEDLYADAA